MRPPNTASLATRVGLSVAIVVAGLAVLEGGLRATFPALPSVAGLEGSDYRLETLVSGAETDDEGLCDEVGSFLSHRSRWGPTTPGRQGLAPPAGQSVTATEVSYGAGSTRRKLWLVGDSVTFGMGVAATATFGARLAERLGAVATVAFKNLGVPAAGYCTALRRLAAEMDHDTPDLVVVVMYADDLEERSMVRVQGRLVAPPDLARSTAVRWIAERSYLGNLAWYAAASWSERGGEGRFMGRRTVEEFGEVAETMVGRVVAAGGSASVALLPAPGEASCTSTDPAARCRWLAEDLERMAAELARRAMPYLDLRGVWPAGVDHIVADERNSIAGGGAAMHPNEAGHAIVAERLWDELGDAWTRRP